MSIPIIKLGWMAGIIDTKGMLIQKKNKMRNTPQKLLAVEYRELAIIRTLGEMTGTKPELKAAQRLSDFIRKSCHEHCPEAHVHVNRFGDELTMPATARWTITGAGMVVVLTSLLPFLVVDRGWREVIEEVTNVTTLTGHGSGAVRKQLRRLQELGWDLPILFQAALVDDVEEEHDGEDQQGGNEDGQAPGTIADHHSGEGP